MQHWNQNYVENKENIALQVKETLVFSWDPLSKVKIAFITILRQTTRTTTTAAAAGFLH